MSIEAVALPATPLEAAIQDLRLVQAELEACEEEYQRLSTEKTEVALRREVLRDKLDVARENMFTQVVKPTQYVSEPVRVMPAYRDEPTPIADRPEAAWSDEKVTDA